MIRAPSHVVGDKHRPLELEEMLDEPFRNLVDEAATAGWDTAEALHALDALVHNYRITYKNVPHPADDPAVKDSGDSNDFGEFPSAEGLVKAFIHGREKP